MSGLGAAGPPALPGLSRFVAAISHMGSRVQLGAVGAARALYHLPYFHAAIWDVKNSMERFITTRAGMAQPPSSLPGMGRLPTSRSVTATASSALADRTLLPVHGASRARLSRRFIICRGPCRMPTRISWSTQRHRLLVSGPRRPLRCCILLAGWKFSYGRCAESRPISFLRRCAPGSL